MTLGKDALAILATGGEMIADHLKGATHDTAIAVVALSRAIVGVLEGVVADGAHKLTPAEADAALTELAAGLKANDAAADARLHDAIITRDEKP